MRNTRLQILLAYVLLAVSIVLLTALSRANADSTVCHTSCRTDSGGHVYCRTVCR